jgi:two-component system LytT family response regulator
MTSPQSDDSGYEARAVDGPDLVGGNMTAAAHVFVERRANATRIQRAAGTSEESRVLIVDANPESRLALERLCRANGLQLLPPAENGAFALRLARMLRPDLVLVDADLPDMTGPELLERLRTDSIAGIVVATRPDLAVRAFETGALDYLLRPVSNKRFIQAMARARMWLAATDLQGQSCGSQRRPGETDRACADVLVGERHHRLYLLDPARVEYVEAEGNYVTYHADSGEYLSRDTLKRLELTLQVHGFLRIENSVLLNVGAIDYLVPLERGRFVFTLRSGMTLRSTLTYRAGILQRLPLARGKREREIGGIT